MSTHRKHIRRASGRSVHDRRIKATWPPRRRRRPRPVPIPTPGSLSTVRCTHGWKPVRPTAQRFYETELFGESD